MAPGLPSGGLDMGKILVLESLSLDGVMQAPGRADEDLRGGFTHGGWAAQYNDPVMFKTMAEGMGQAGPLLFGRRTYEDFFKVWPARTDSPFSAVLDNTQKYVTSTTLSEPLPWKNSTLLKGDAADTVKRLKDQLEKDLLVMGSGELVKSLSRHDLVDEYMLLIHPLLLGAGRRLFPDDGPFAALRLVNCVTTTTGVMMATYKPAEGERSIVEDEQR
jgi:dihydrofolate reductase